MTGKAPRPCRICYATVADDLMAQHEKWHKINDLHAESCRKAVQQDTTVHFTPLACSCGLT